MALDKEIVSTWDYVRWPNFSEVELACRHCGQFKTWPEFLDRLQSLRNRMGRPLHILSGHRCSIHNAYVGGAPLSEHLRLAVDISLLGHNRFQLADMAKSEGFRGLGYYTTFLHLDLGKHRHWYGGEKAKELWRVY